MKCVNAIPSFGAGNFAIRSLLRVASVTPSSHPSGLRSRKARPLEKMHAAERRFEDHGTSDRQTACKPASARGSQARSIAVDP
jgi:hypothetical protein